MIDEIMENPAFWILGGGGVACELAGWIVSKKYMAEAFPLWQLIIMMVGTLIAAAFFATRD